MRMARVVASKRNLTNKLSRHVDRQTQHESLSLLHYKPFSLAAKMQDAFGDQVNVHWERNLLGKLRAV